MLSIKSESNGTESHDALRTPTRVGVKSRVERDPSSLRQRRALLMALFSAATAVALFFLYTQKFEREFSGGERVRLLVATRPLERGLPITDDALTFRDVPQAYVEDRAVRATDKAKIIGLRVGGPVQAQETLMWTDLAVASEDRRELSSLVQPGSRAATLRLRDEGSASGVRPGDYVDILTLRGDSAEARSSTVVLQHVLVLAVGGSTRPEDLEKGLVGGRMGDLTVSATLQDAQLLAVAAERGGLSVVLRNSDDNRTVDRVPSVTLASIAETPRDDSHARRPSAAGPREVRASADAHSDSSP